LHEKIIKKGGCIPKMKPPLVFLLTLLGVVTSSLGENLVVNTSSISDKLQVGFYKLSCPNAEKIIEDVITKSSKQNQGIIPGIIRLHFHDCYLTVSSTISVF
jgi:peroxidase